MSSINIDLDFHDYAPTSGNNNKGRISTTGQHLTRNNILKPDDDSSNQTSQKPSVLEAIENMNRISSNQLPNVVTREAIQQAIFMSSRHKNKQPRSIFSEWGLGYLAQYFDVTTDDVMRRILWSSIPIQKTGIDLDDLNNQEMTSPLTSNMTHEPLIGDQDEAGDQILTGIYNPSSVKQKRYSYIERFIQSRPDLYGPFWITVTLIFAVALFSNIANFKKYQIRMNQLDPALQQGNIPLEEWHYSMDELNTATSVVLFYITLVPTFLWFLFWFRGCTQYYTLIETICAYGYCLSLFIPLVILLTVQVSIFRFLSICLLSAPSTIVLILSFLPVIKSDPNKAGSQLALIIIPVCQIGLAYIIHRIMLQ